MGFFDRLLGTRPRTSTDEAADAADAASELTDAEREQTTARIAEIDAELASAPGPSSPSNPSAASSPSSPSTADPADLHEELGTLHERLGDTDAAIASFEASLEARPRYGTSYNRLMDLYNTRRAQAASAGDGTAINQWMSKIDALLATSKRIMRENY